MTKEAISKRRFPFGPSGDLLPDGPDITSSIYAPDLKGLPWTRLDVDAWTTEEQRGIVKAFLVSFLAAHDWTHRWAVIERRAAHTRRSGLLKNPILIFQVTRQADGEVFEHAIEFPKPVRDDLDRFAAQLLSATAAFEALNSQ